MNVYTRHGQTEQLHIRHETEDRAVVAAANIMATGHYGDRIFFVATDDVTTHPFAVLSVQA